MNRMVCVVILLSIYFFFISIKCVQIVVDRVCQEEIMKAYHGGIDVPLHFRVLSGHFGRNKMGAMGVARWHFPHIIKTSAEIIRQHDVCQHVNTYNLQNGNKTLHPFESPEGMEPDRY